MGVLGLLLAGTCLPTEAQTGHGADRPGKGPLKVFILAGQSNMVGTGLNTHLQLAAAEGESGRDFKRLLDSNGNVIERKDVWIYYNGRTGNLTPGSNQKYQ